MIPVSTGFIFPNGSYLDTASVGHCKCAYKYIEEHNLQNEFKKYNGAADDFLIERLGAMKICHYRCNHYIYMPRNCGWYMEQLKKMYEREGYIVKDCYMQDITIDIYEHILITRGYSYNQTVVKSLDSNGKVIYIYNPAREGD